MLGETIDLKASLTVPPAIATGEAGQMRLEAEVRSETDADNLLMPSQRIRLWGDFAGRIWWRPEELSDEGRSVSLSEK